MKDKTAAYSYIIHYGYTQTAFCFFVFIHCVRMNLSDSQRLDSTEVQLIEVTDIY